MEFDNISHEAHANLLLGNGFSIGIHGGFHYASLRGVAVQKGFLSSTEDRLFKKFSTTDFERLMRRLSDAARVNKVLGIDHKTPQDKYVQIKNALIQSVREVHVRYDDIRHDWLESIAEFLKSRDYSTIFTTNYDLLLYWVLGSRHFHGFTDLFWSDSVSFNPINTDIWGRKTEVYYLHGALFLFQNYLAESEEVSTPYKIRKRQGSDLLNQVEEEMNKDNLPLFVSEGRSQDKEAAILNNVYLSYALRRFSRMETGVTIFGHSLSSSDNHIVNAINRNRNLKVIAVSVYSAGRDEAALVDAMTGFEERLKQFTRAGGKIEFFDYRSCPLAVST